MRWKSHVRFGGRAEETDRLKGQHRASVRSDHTCASFLVESGVHPKEMSEWLGRSSIVITLDRYSHVFPQLTAAVARRLDSARSRAVATDETLAPVVPLR